MRRLAPQLLRLSPAVRRPSVAAASQPLVVLVARRSAATGGSLPGNTPGAEGWRLRPGHHLQSSSGLHSPITTACGRKFDPQVYYEMLHACCDQRWLQAIQKELYTDKEYIDSLRLRGGSAKDLQLLTQSTSHDDEFMTQLLERLRTDEKVSLSLCALQESYTRIRERRDLHETEKAASGSPDPYSSLKDAQQRQGGFGAPTPPF